MKYKLKPKKKKPEIGDTRIIRRFAWFPVLLEREIRWLEQVTIEQMYGIFGWSDWRYKEE